MGDPLVTAILAILAVLLSALSAISGLGGGIFLIPLLILLLKLPLKFAAGTMLLAMVPFTAVATFRNIQNKYVNFKIGFFIQVGAVIGVLIGAHFSVLLPDIVLKLMFLFIVLYLLISLQVKEKSEFNLAAQVYFLLNRLPPRIALQDLATSEVSISALVVLGIIAGFFSGLLGIGGGFMIVPLFIIGMRLPVKVAVGTSLFMILITSSVGAIQHAILDHVRYHLSFILGGGMIIGAAAGAALLKKISERRLRKLILVVLILAAVAVILR
jgi:uncharacterized membrane protein YfcA